MKATGTTFEILDACDDARVEAQKTLDSLTPKTARSRLRYIERRTKWDLFRRDSEYWAGRWENSSDRQLTIQCNGTRWLEDSILEQIDKVEKQVQNITALTTFTLDADEVYALSYTHERNP